MAGSGVSPPSPLSPAEQAAVSASGLLARCRFPLQRTAVVAGVSGGADSTALLVLALAAGLSVSVVHVDHGLRPTSGSDGAAVVALCARWSVPCAVVRVDVAPGPNLEARARAARYAALPNGVMTGHTADDRVESLLLNLLRGAGLDGLVPMAPRPGAPVRPLLGVRRSETVALCSALGIDVVHDAMNDDPSFRRVRVRHELVPGLDDIAQRDVVEVLARQIELLSADAELLNDLAARLDPTDAVALTGAPVPLASRSVRRWLSAAGMTPGPVAEQAVVERVLSVARGAAVGADLVGGWSVRRTAQRLRLEHPGSLDPTS